MSTPTQMDIFQAAPAAPVQNVDFPFRGTLRTALPEEIDALNVALDFKGARAMEPAEDAIQRIASIKSPSSSRLWGWALHPDERVQLALLQSDLVGSRRKRTRFAVDVIWYAFARHALVGARAAPTELWNPLLDAISDKNVWSHTPGRFAHRPDRPQSLTVDKSIPFMVEKEYLQHVESWASTQRDLSKVRALLDMFVSRAFIEAVIRAVPVMDVETARHIAERAPASVQEIAKKSALPRDVARFLKDWAIEAIAHVEELTKHPRMNRNAVWSGPGAEVLDETSGFQLTFADHERLISMIREVGDSEAWQDSPVLQAARYYRRNLRFLPPDVLMLILPTLRGRRGLSYDVQGVLERDDLTVEVARVIAQYYPSSHIRLALARNERWRNDPEIRSRLVQSRAADVAQHTMSDAQGDEFARIFRRIARTHPDVAALALDDRLEEVAPHLAREDLVPLLTAEDTDARITAMQAVSQVKAKRTRGRKP